MGKQIIKEDFYVRVEPKLLCYGIRIHPTEKDQHELCKSIVDQIVRHVNEVASATVHYTRLEQCEHCGATWTEDEDDYNGGCCDKDQENES